MDRHTSVAIRASCALWFPVAFASSSFDNSTGCSFSPPWSDDMGAKRVLMVAGVAAVIGLASIATCRALQREYKSGIVWPEPKVVTPGKTDTEPPSDAIVLFAGKDLSKSENGDKWEVKDGVATVKSADITTKESFGDYQLHLEFASPEKVSGRGQGRGNSGVYL